jgi:hypothetical protein
VVGLGYSYLRKKHWFGFINLQLESDEGREEGVVIRMEVHYDCFMHSWCNFGFFVVYEIEERTLGSVDLDLPGLG